MFDVSDTLVVEELAIGLQPRSETLVETLQNLKEKGVLLYAVSSVAESLSDYGFPAGLLIPARTTSPVKTDAIRDILSSLKLPPDAALFLVMTCWMNVLPKLIPYVSFRSAGPTAVKKTSCK